jgi:HK97 family phage portal protein
MVPTGWQLSSPLWSARELMTEPEILSPDEVAALEQGYAGLVSLETKGPGLSLDNTGIFLVPEARSTKSGVTVTTRTAMEISAVMAAATVVSEDVGKLPLELYRWDTKDKSGRTKVGKSTREPMHPLARLMETRPNAYMTPQSFRETLTLHAMLWGEGCAWKASNTDGEVGELWPMMPGQCVPRWEAEGELVYDVWFDDAWTGSWQAVSVPPERIFRVTGLSWDGICGINRVTLAREVFGLSKRLTEAQAKFYGKDQRPSAILSSKNKVSAEKIDRIRATWQRQFGPDGEGGIALLDDDFTYSAMGVSAKDADSIALWRLMVEEACRVFRVQPVKVMHATGTQSYASIEQLNYAHLTDTLEPWLRRWEQGAERDLLGHDPQLYWHFDRDQYLRPLPKDRWDIYVKGRQTNALTVNEIRDREELAPDDDERADDLFAPIGTNPTPAAGRAPPAKPGKPADKPEEKPDDGDGAAAKAWRRLFGGRHIG